MWLCNCSCRSRWKTIGWLVTWSQKMIRLLISGHKGTLGTSWASSHWSGWLIHMIIISLICPSWFAKLHPTLLRCMIVASTISAMSISSVSTTSMTTSRSNSSLHDQQKILRQQLPVDIVLWAEMKNSLLSQGRNMHCCV